MIFDALNQNRSLDAAAQAAKDTRPRVDVANEASKKTSEGKGAQETALSKGRKRMASSETQARPLPRPSLEGFVNSPSAHIAFNNTGYTNPSLQKQRYQKTNVQEFVNNKKNMFSSMKTLDSGIMDRAMTSLNYTNRSSSGSSSQRISDIVRTNNTF